MTSSSPQTPPPNTPSTIAEELLGGVIAAVVAGVCLLIPVVHFVAGPLGPGIGAFIAAGRIHTGWRGRIIISLTAGLLLGAFVGAAFALMVHLSGDAAGMPEWLKPWLQADRQLLIMGGAGGYACVLAGIGATLSAVFKD